MFGKGKKGRGQGGDRIDPRVNAPLRQIEAYWESLRQSKRLPARAEVDPRGIERALRHAFVLERIAPGVARIRVSGTVLSGFLETDARGLPFSLAFGMTSRRNIARVLEDVFDGPATARIQIKEEGNGAGIGEICLLPMTSRSGAVTRILGGIAFSDDKTPAARRLTVVSSFLREIHSSADAPHDRYFDKPKGSPVMRPTQVPYLRLIVNES